MSRPPSPRQPTNPHHPEQTMRHAISRLPRLLCTWLAVALGALALPAQPAAEVSPNNVTFFTEPNFKGEALTVEAGAAVENLEQMLRPNQKSWAFAISSVRVEGSAQASVFGAIGFAGDRLEITRSLADLYSEIRPRDVGATWDRAIVSLSVTQRGAPPALAPPPPPGNPPATSPSPLPPISPPAAHVARNEPGPSTVIIVTPRPPPPPPPVVMREVRPRLDRRTAEIIVQRAFREVLNRPADPDGLRTYRDRLMFEGWSEQQVIQQLQRSGEARGVNADDAITKTYREVLGHDPDPNGLAHYRAKWRDGWTQGQIRDDLRRSPEALRATIIRVYREVLGRDPDPSGYATYEKAMRERRWTEKELRAALMSGDEYRQRQKARR